LFFSQPFVFFAVTLIIIHDTIELLMKAM